MFGITFVTVNIKDIKMKKFQFSLFFFVFFAVVSFGQAKELSNATLAEASDLGPAMTFESMIVDYGDIAQHSDPLRVIKFTNTGSEPLLIKSARGSCGCTVPTWPKEAIMPGESNKIEIRYDTKRLGKINKKVTITTNDGGEPYVLSVVGSIKASDESESVPKAPGSIIKKNN